ISSTVSRELMSLSSSQSYLVFVFFNDAPPTRIYALSLHDALPIFVGTTPRPPRPPRPFGSRHRPRPRPLWTLRPRPWQSGRGRGDRKSTRLNSSHVKISYAVFCLKKKNTPTKKVEDHLTGYRNDLQ